MSKQKKQHTEPTSGGFNALPWITSVLLVVGVAVVAGLYWNRTVVIQDVEYTGHRFTTEQELVNTADVPTGIPPDSVNFMSIIKQLERIPYVKRAAVNVKPSGNLTIQITERQPIAMLANGTSKIYVDEGGIRLPMRLGNTVGVPIVYGFSTHPLGDTLQSEAWQQTRDFLTELNTSSFNHATISEIAWTKTEGIVALSHENGVKLIFGKGDFSKKFRNWKAFYAEVISSKGINKLRSVDLRFENQIVTRES